MRGLLQLSFELRRSFCINNRFSSKLEDTRSYPLWNARLSSPIERNEYQWWWWQWWFLCLYSEHCMHSFCGLCVILERRGGSRQFYSVRTSLAGRHCDVSWTRGQLFVRALGRTHSDHVPAYKTYKVPGAHSQYLMHFGLRDSLQNGIKWENLVDIPIQNDAANAFVNNFFRLRLKNSFPKAFLTQFFIRISTTFSLTSFPLTLT